MNLLKRVFCKGYFKNIRVVLLLFNFAVENVGRASNRLNIKTDDFSNGIEY